MLDVKLKDCDWSTQNIAFDLVGQHPQKICGEEIGQLTFEYSEKSAFSGLLDVL